jgi:trk system potassium uptake protein
LSKQARGLSYAVRFSVLGKYFGQLCIVLSLLTVFPLAFSFVSGETHIFERYLLVIALTAGLGWLLGRMRAPSEVQVNEAMVLVATMFLFTPLVMTFPMMGSGLSFFDALFETISAATTTGLSTVKTIEEMPKTFLFSRAWMQWYGGLGIVVLSLALLFRPGAVAKRFALAESSEDDLVGGTKAHARVILGVYTMLTVAGVLLLVSVGTGFLNSLLYTLASVSTGGFAPHDASLAALGGPVRHYVVILICFSGSVPLIFYYRLYSGNKRWGTETLQLRGILLMGGIMTLVFAACLVTLDDTSWTRALHYAPVLVFSAQSTAGFTVTDLSELHAASKLVLMMSMVVGGGIGSTAGGFKILRLIIILNVLGNILRSACSSKHAVVSHRTAGRRMADMDIQEALLIVLLVLAVILLSWFPFVFMGYSPLDSLFEVVSAVGTVGLSVGVVGPDMPVFLKGVLCVDMLLGRLEILAWLVMVFPRTWVGRRLR